MKKSGLVSESMSRPRVLLQLDTDRHASVFDAVVAIDAGVDHLLRHADVAPDAVRDLVYGLMFTRGGDDLKHSAVFVGGSDVAAAEALLKQVTGTFFGPVRVSAMLDPSGANTTAVAAVLAASQHLELAGCRAVVLAGTGPVGRRVSKLLALSGAEVGVVSRSLDRAETVCSELASEVSEAKLWPHASGDEQSFGKALDGAKLVISAGPPGTQLLSKAQREAAGSLAVAIDLSAVPPLGIEGIEPQDQAVEHAGVICYGAIGVGGTKMKVHKAAIERLFERNDQVLDAEEILEIGRQIIASQS